MEDLELAKQGDYEALERIINQIKYKLYKTGMAILKNDDDVCDALQETLISIYKNIGKLEKQEYFSTWAIRILINKCNDIMRKNKKIKDINDKMKIDTINYYDIYEKESILENVLNNIDENLRLITVLYYYDDLSVSKISDTLNIPEGTVKSRLSRARNKIYELIKKDGGEE